MVLQAFKSEQSKFDYIICILLSFGANDLGQQVYVEYNPFEIDS